MTPRPRSETSGLQLEKLGIREIQERLEFSPILTDPGFAGLDAVDGSTKSYVCTINIDPTDIKPTEIG